VLPDALVDQLKLNGRMVIPVGTSSQVLFSTSLGLLSSLTCYDHQATNSRVLIIIYDHQATNPRVLIIIYDHSQP
jgi:protein-L-isoaspartate O-methyltransferase